MSRAMTRSEREAFLAEPRVAVLSVAGADDRPPHSTPSFYAYTPGGEITFFTNTQGRTANKVALIAAAGAVTLTVQEPEFPYRYASVEGRVVAAGRPSADQVRAIASRYSRGRDGRRGDVRPDLDDHAVHGAAGALAHGRLLALAHAN